MEYKKIGETYYVRMDRDDEVIEKILEVCHKESITSAVFSGIGGCKNAELQLFIPDTGCFESLTYTPLLSRKSSLTVAVMRYP